MNDEISTIVAKIPKKQKEAYKKLCKKNDTTISQEVRKFINSELEKDKE